MSRPSKPLTLSRIEDLTLGSFAFVPTSETIDHLVRYLSTWSGSDKLFMIIQYAVKLVIPLLQFRARLQYRAGTRPSAHSGAAESLTKVYNLIGDARMFFRIMISTTRRPVADHTVALVDRTKPTANPPPAHA